MSLISEFVDDQLGWEHWGDPLLNKKLKDDWLGWEHWPDGLKVALGAAAAFFAWPTLSTWGANFAAWAGKVGAKVSFDWLGKDFFRIFRAGTDMIAGYNGFNLANLRGIEGDFGSSEWWSTFSGNWNTGSSVNGIVDAIVKGALIVGGVSIVASLVGAFTGRR
jgi:hypothetical protein